MSSLGSLVVSLAMDTGRFTADIGKAAQQLTRLTAEAAKVGAAVGAAVTASVSALAYMTKQSIDAADEMGKLAASSGTTVEELSRLGYAADLSGLALGDLGTALQKLARHSADAASGGKQAAQVYAAMGIAVKDGNGNLRSSTEILADVAEKFATYEDGAAKTALAQELFGKSGAALIPLLNQGRDGLAKLSDESDRLGITMSAGAAKAAEEFNDNLTRLTKVQQGFSNNLAQALLPALEFVSKEIAAAALNTNGFRDSTVTLVQWLSKLLVPLEAIAVLAVNVAYVFKQVGIEIGGIAAQAAALARLDLRGAKAIGEMMKEDAAAARKQVDDLSDYILSWSKKVGQLMNLPQASFSNEGRNYQRVTKKVTAPIIAAADEIKAAKITVDKTVEAIERRLSDMQLDVDTRGASERVRGLIELTRQGATGEQLQRFVELSRAMEDYKNKVEQAALADKRQADDLREMQELYKETRTPVEELAATLARLEELRAKGLDFDVYARAVFAAQEKFEAATKSAEKTLDNVSVFVERARQNIQDSIGDGLVEIMNGNFKNIGDAFVKMLQRMVAEALAAKLTEALFGPAKPGGTGGGGIFGNVLSSIGSFLFGGKAYGGPVSAGRAVRVGEHGPEVFMPATAGSIIPERQLAGPPRSIVVNVQAVPGMSRQTALQQGQLIGEGVQRALVRNA